MYQSRIRANKKRGGNKKRELLEPEEGQNYGIAMEMMGNGRIRIFCDDKQVRPGRIRGSMRKYSGKVLIDKGDLILYAGRDYGPDVLDVFHKYTHEEVAELMRHNILPENILKKLNMDGDDDTKVTKDDYVLFMNDGPVPATSDSEAGAAAEGSTGDPSSESGDEVDIDAI